MAAAFSCLLPNLDINKQFSNIPCTFIKLSYLKKKNQIMGPSQMWISFFYFKNKNKKKWELTRTSDIWSQTLTLTARPRYTCIFRWSLLTRRLHFNPMKQRELIIFVILYLTRFYLFLMGHYDDMFKLDCI